MEHRQEEHAEQSPQQREGQADPSVQVAGQAVIVPKGDAPGFFIENAAQILHPRGHGRCGQEDQDGVPLGQQGDDGGTDAVDGTEGEEEAAFAVGFGRVGQAGVEDFPHKAQQAVAEQIPNEIHLITTPQFGQLGENHTEIRSISRKSPSYPQLCRWESYDKMGKIHAEWKGAFNDEFSAFDRFWRPDPGRVGKFVPALRPDHGRPDGLCPGVQGAHPGQPVL